MVQIEINEKTAEHNSCPLSIGGLSFNLLSYARGVSELVYCRGYSYYPFAFYQFRQLTWQFFLDRV